MHQAGCMLYSMHQTGCTLCSMHQAVSKSTVACIKLAHDSVTCIKLALRSIYSMHQVAHRCAGCACMKYIGSTCNALRHASSQFITLQFIHASKRLDIVCSMDCPSEAIINHRNSSIHSAGIRQASSIYTFSTMHQAGSIMTEQSSSYIKLAQYIQSIACIKLRSTVYEVSDSIIIHAACMHQASSAFTPIY